MIKLTCSIFMFSNNFLVIFFLNIWNHLKIHQLKIIKIIKKDYKKKKKDSERGQSLSKEEKEKKQ